MPNAACPTAQGRYERAGTHIASAALVPVGRLPLRWTSERTSRGARAVTGGHSQTGNTGHPAAPPLPVPTHPTRYPLGAAPTHRIAMARRRRHRCLRGCVRCCRWSHGYKKGRRSPLDWTTSSSSHRPQAPPSTSYTPTTPDQQPIRSPPPHVTAADPRASTLSSHGPLYPPRGRPRHRLHLPRLPVGALHSRPRRRHGAVGGAGHPDLRRAVCVHHHHRADRLFLPCPSVVGRGVLRRRGRRAGVPPQGRPLLPHRHARVVVQGGCHHHRWAHL